MLWLTRSTQSLHQIRTLKYAWFILPWTSTPIVEWQSTRKINSGTIWCHSHSINIISIEQNHNLKNWLNLSVVNYGLSSLNKRVVMIKKNSEAFWIRKESGTKKIKRFQAYLILSIFTLYSKISLTYIHKINYYHLFWVKGFFSNIYAARKSITKF